MVTDSQGNGYVAGIFDGEGGVDLGGGKLDFVGGFFDAFVAKYDANGNYLWSKAFGSDVSDACNGVAVDPQGNVVVAGQFGGTINFGGDDLVSLGGSSFGVDTFVAKFSPGGEHLWSKRFGGTEDDLAVSVATDSQGNLVVAGTFWGTANFGGTDLTAAGTGLYADVFVAKYDANGEHLWSHAFGDPDSNESGSANVDGSGNVVLLGLFAGTIEFQGHSLHGAGSKDIFMAKCDEDGNHLWSHGYGGPGYEYGVATAFDGANNIVAGGQLLGSVDFGGGELDGESSPSIFVAKFRP